MKLAKNCRYTVHEFKMGDVEDPDIVVAQPIYEWQQTEFGKWCMKHGNDMAYHIGISKFGYTVTIDGEFDNKHGTLLALKKT